jgi:hypothetical protein
VVVVTDGLSAFREESLRRAYGDFTAQACWSDGSGWVLVDWGSSLRPDPRPPAQARGWREALARVGRNRLRFARRRT